MGFLYATRGKVENLTGDIAEKWMALGNGAVYTQTTEIMV